MGCLAPLIEFQHQLCTLVLGVSVGSTLSRLTLSFSTRTLSNLLFSNLVDLALSSSSASGPFANSDSAGTLFSLVVCRSASLVGWVSPSTTNHQEKTMSASSFDLSE